MSRIIFAFITCGVFAVTYSASFVKDPSTKIIGGQPAIEGLLPYQVSMQYQGEHWCGGSIVEVSGKQVVVTSTSCVITSNNSDWTLIAGELNTTEISGHEQRRQVTNFVMHENYTVYRISQINDIAIMFYDAPFDLNEFVQPIALPRPLQQTTSDVVASGWGVDNRFSYNMSEILQYAVLPTVTEEECKESYRYERILETHICAGVLNGGKNSCSGDNGGPLVALDGDYLAGIVSWGYYCEDVPGVNTEVSYFVDWIKNTVAAN